MPRIRIVSTPEMPGIHERIREGWIGVELEAKGPYEYYKNRKVEAQKVLVQIDQIIKSALGHKAGEKIVYEVPVSAALEALEKNNEMAWRWFFYAFIFMRPPVLIFPVECCIDL